MGDVAISALLNVVLEKLITSEDILENGILWRFKDDILNIKDQFEDIKVFIHDAEEKRSRNEEVDLWLKKLRSAIEKLLDSVLTEAKLQSLFKERCIKPSVRTFFSTDHDQFHRRITHTLKDIRSKLDDIVSQIYELNLDSIGTIHVDTKVEGNMPHKKPGSVFGRRQDLKNVIEKICNKDIGKLENGEIRVYGIWGKGGMGKTTLAKSVYKHEKVNKDLKFKYWVNVEKITEAKEIMIRIIKEIDNSWCELTSLVALQSYIQRKLSGKKFLIVLDDICIEDHHQWDILSRSLSGGTEGSIVMMTTGSEKTFRMMAKVPILHYPLEPLSKEASWSLFKTIAFEGLDADDIRELQPIGWKIVEKCKGVPLIVNKIARIMQSKKSKYAWMNVMKNNIDGLLGTEISQENMILSQKDVALKDLKSTYDSLLPHLKRCFAYCYLFPKGYDIEKNVAIQLWVVNNFIPPIGKKDLYVLGKEIFDCLIQKSLFQVVKDDKQRSNSRFRVHDLMHDITVLKAVEDEFFVIPPESKGVINPDKVIHLSSTCSSYSFPTQLDSLRSIFMFGKINEACTSQIFKYHLNIRVLYLCGIELKKLPDSICNLKYLEYLDLSYSSIEVLPESICYLQNLQMLLLKFCYELYKLPEGMKYMRSLRLLDVTSCHSLRHLPSGIEGLTGIRRLPRFHVGNNSKARVATLGELGKLNHLEVDLEISGLENVKDEQEANNANLKAKTNVSNL